MPLVAVALVRGERAGGRPVAALVLPAVEAAVHRYDVGVAELSERVCGEGRPHTTGAHDDDGLVAVGDPVLDAGLEVAPWYVDRTWDRPLLVLVGLADVEQEVALG